MVRLVFRPYTQIRRSICTSESLRASTRVSSGFTLFRHSSPSFGSQHTRSTAGPSQKFWSGRRCPPRQRSQLSLSLRARVLNTQTLAGIILSMDVSRSPKPTRGHAEFLNPNRRIRSKAITHPEGCHIPSTLLRRSKLMLTRQPGNAPNKIARLIPGQRD
ncbi:hypothetical protein SERLA73DRAFT_80747 [Serpula lacrymans var. lacrymans S7.3]|uniref:Uncharacterized protein n=1 Tax=Serpula lacrymans var. lacrymans (strain S7.3) TaxID=936435 RepID=F8QK75_SERL3|nr:hypothetical protein SERLA73DRAFT_80747 [Serpula lacrymans var. lacrymans S7.3]